MNLDSQSRLISLDGMRGVAAFAVMLSHMGVNPLALIDSPLFMLVYRMVSSGSNAVQVLFVLSGFLMAFLYPVINNPFGFIQKRYARIIPVYAVVVLYIWWTTVGKRYVSVLEHTVSLGVIALVCAVFWLIVEKINSRKFPLGGIIFSLFVGFQGIYLLFSMTLLPKLMSGTWLPITDAQKTTLVMLSNLTLTVPFTTQIMTMSGVFWSLVPEMLFYIVYPFLVVPLISISNKWGLRASLFITLAVVKILFDLDMASLSLFSLHGMFIARATGFVVGVWIGTLYKNRAQTWLELERIFKNPVVSFASLAAFFLLIGFEWGDAVYQVRHYLNTYYVVLSVVIGLLVVSAVTPKTLAQNFFSHKILVFFGMISYSLYLIHSEVIHVTQSYITRFWNSFIGEGKSSIITTTISLILLSTFTAYFLFKVVESLYFRNKLKKKTTDEKQKQSSTVLAKYELYKPVSVIKTIGLGVITSLFFIGVYAGVYSPSLIMSHHDLPVTRFFEPLIVTDTKPITVEFTATQPDLSVVFLGLDYVRDPSVLMEERSKSVELVFKLYDEQGTLLSESQRSPRLAEGIPHFPFGFPQITNSQGKKYTVELSLKDALPTDKVYVKNHPDSLVTQYTTVKTNEITYFATLLLQRLYFSLSSSSTQFAVVFVWLIVALVLKLNKQHARLTQHP